MKGVPKYCFLFLGLLLGFVTQAQERITHFAVQLQLDTTNTLTVQEHISIVAEGEVFKRGLIRRIPYYRKDINGESVANPITLLSVTQDGKNATYKDHSKSSELEIKIGDADVLLAPGAHTYVITYQIKYQVGFFDSYDEIYWNVTGNEWGDAYRQREL